MNYSTAVLKNKIEVIATYPLVALGKLLGYIFPLQNKGTIFLFFPSADIGGAIKVNADIVNCINDKQVTILFSKKPKNNLFKHLFEVENVTLIDLSQYIDNKTLHFINIIYRGVIATWINRVDKPVVFGGECIYFYKILPYLKKNTKTIELCHLNTWLNYTQAYVRFINYRVFSTKKIKRDVSNQYASNKVPDKYKNNLHFIDNKVAIPPYSVTDNAGLQILFVGRGAAQKRVYLIKQIAEQLVSYAAQFHFTFVGDVEKIIAKNELPNCTVLGNVNDEQQMHKLYQQADVLILTSAYEGLPIVVMDMMARGKVVVSTAVDGIPDYITHLQNGILLYEKDEREIVREAVGALKDLSQNKNLLLTLGKNSYDYATKNFSAANFDTFYKQLFT